jgi:transcriptional regulator with XRE-family HTH domain
MAGDKKPNPIDVYVGGRVRLRRLMIGMSQEKLGEEVGLTFQQIQKYEKGVNRIGASRLYQLSQVLNVPIQFFFQDAPIQGTGASPAASQSEQDSVIYDFLNSREGLELNRAYVRISDARVRRSIVDLMRSLSSAAASDTSL